MSAFGIRNRWCVSIHNSAGVWEHQCTASLPHPPSTGRPSRRALWGVLLRPAAGGRRRCGRRHDGLQDAAGSEDDQTDWRRVDGCEQRIFTPCRLPQHRTWRWTWASGATINSRLDDLLTTPRSTQLWELNFGISPPPAPGINEPVKIRHMMNISATLCPVVPKFNTLVHCGMFEVAKLFWILGSL